ncbi:glycoside hydrolase family 55 protein [Lentinula raphanica]|uniref:Glycoside hydrolase family 55 protein n=1 Tax=Lentinula raphanica TaxID=153919 RepID=A0AA38P9H2_9AGAR|nr:glycoside hydrolase family 55 protein [Lentinula raphanica]KAJ3838600.1 glycoside hydrolase family 55 protein [Lentinula raphanica]
MNLFSPRSAPADTPYWRELIKHQGTSPFNPNSTYVVYRNVKEYGAKGDGVTDDSAAFNLAISDGGRCGGGNCQSSTITPAVVFVPTGVYRLKHAITLYYMTQLLGDARYPPTLLADESFRDMAVIDADPYIVGGGGAQWFMNQNNFYKTVKNFIIDVRRVPAALSQGTGIHWQVAQATSLQNIKFYMSEDPNTAHQGIWMENGSGGFMSDLTFYGGKFGMWVGNQQFTVQNVTMSNCQTAVFGVWNWGWTFQGITINNCSVGFDLLTGGTTSASQSVGSETIVDAVVNNTPYFVRSSNTSNDFLSGSLVLINVQLNNVPVAVGALNQSKPLLPGTSGVMHIAAWGQGNVYRGSNPKFSYTQGTIQTPRISESLLDSEGRIVCRNRPQYEDYSLDQIVSAKDYGAKGDGKADDTQVLQALLNQAANNKIVFLDAGVYLITTTLLIPAGTRLTGEAWSTISATGSYFADPENPRVAVRVGEEGSQGVVEITDILFSTKGAVPGAILVEWNVRDPIGAPASAGMWDTHFRIGGAAGTELQLAQCPINANNVKDCTAVFLSLHITKKATAYLESTWIWVADHTLDEDGVSKLEIHAGRGVLSHSRGPVWMIGTSEHHVIYQYRLTNANNHYLGFVQTESPYDQPIPPAPYPFSLNEAFSDPTFPADLNSSWSLSIAKSHNIVVLGAGFYSFFYNYENSCSQDNEACQSQIVDIDSESSVQLYSVSTVGVQYPISVDHKGIPLRQDNLNGFAETVTVWTSS